MHPCLSFRLSSHTCQGIFHRDVADIGRPVLSLLHRCCDIHFPSQTCPLGRLIHARYATHAFQMLSIGYALIDQRFRRPLCNSLLDPFSPWARNLQHQGSLYTHYERDTLYERDSVECSVCCLMSDTKISPAILPNVSTKHILQHKGKRKKKQQRITATHPSPSSVNHTPRNASINDSITPSYHPGGSFRISSRSSRTRWITSAAPGSSPKRAHRCALRMFW